MLAFLEPLEGSAVEKVRGMSLQYPTKQEAVYLCNGAVSEKSPQIFRPPLPVEYVTVFSGRTDAPGVRCDLTDRHTDTHTHRPNYSNPRCACAPRVNECTKVQNPRRPCVRESLKAHAVNLIYNARARMLERHVRLKLKVGSVHCWKRYIGLTGAVPMLVLPHAVTAGASLYFEQEYLIAGKPE